MHNLHVNTAPEIAKLCVMIPYFNPVGYKGAFARYQQCTAALQRQGVPYRTVEVVMGNREFELEEPNVLQLRTTSSLWHKEASLNALLHTVPSHYKYIAWIDRDIILENDNWMRDTVRKLHHCAVVQLYERVEELNAFGKKYFEREGAFYALLEKHIPLHEATSGKYYQGGALAMHRSILEKCGGLFDVTIIGGGDTLFMRGCLGILQKPEQWMGNFNAQIIERYQQWQQLLFQNVQNAIGYIPGSAIHQWHGEKEKRHYSKRHSIIKDLDLASDIRRNTDGLWEWTPSANISIKNAVEQYFHDREEDGSTTDTPQFTTDWFMNRSEILKKILAEYAGKPNIHMLEIGCFEGRSTCWFLLEILTHSTSSITCIDTFSGSIEHQNTLMDLSQIEQRFRTNIHCTGSKNKVHVHVGASQDILTTLPTNTYTFAYIDGSHIAPDVLHDLVSTWRLLQENGLMIIDDYHHDLFFEARNNPKAAIDAFISIYHAEIEVVHTDWMMILRKIARPLAYPLLRIHYTPLIGIAGIHNEEDILDEWAQYHLCILDKLIVILHNCTDASKHILEQLIQKGYSIEIRESSVMYHAQGTHFTDCLRTIPKKSCRWIIPLDADEFLCDSSNNVRETLLSSTSNTPIALPWKTYVPTSKDDCTAPKLLQRYTYRRAYEPRQFTKMLIPNSLIKKAILHTGNHHITNEKGKEYPCSIHPTLYLAHFPVRTAEQLRTKIIRSWHNVLLNPERKPDQSFQWSQLYNRCLDPTPFTREELEIIALRYATKPEDPLVDAVHDPISLLQ